MPLKEVQAGQKAVGRTVFAGSKVEEFEVEILGVLENIGPKQNIILGRLSGGPIARTGVMQGMSGSPVYIGGRLIGAVALAFPFAKEPIAGIRPIEEMLAGGATPGAPRAEVKLGEARLAEVATPVSFSGFTGRAVEQFASRWREMGLEPLQGVGGKAAAHGTSQPIEPGSMISVQLVSGDMSVGADGTVTHIDGNRIYGFGHRFLGLGGAEMPFSRSEVLTLLPNLGTSFKISGSREPLGTISFDGNAAIAGDLGRGARMVPVTIRVAGAKSTETYRMEVIHHTMLTGFLTQMMLFSAIDSTERTLGTSTVEVETRASIAGQSDLVMRQTLANDFNAPLVAALNASAPLSTLFMASSSPVRLTGLEINVKVEENRRTLQVDQLTLSQKSVRPGETVDIAVTLTGDGGKDRVETVRYVVPNWMPPGQIQITAADSLSANVSDGKVMLGLNGTRPLGQVVKQLNAFRDSGSVYVRVWRSEPGYSVSGVEMSNLPAGMSMLMARQAQGSTSAPLSSKLAEFERQIGSAVSGQKTVQLEVKE